MNKWPRKLYFGASLFVALQGGAHATYVNGNPLSYIDPNGLDVLLTNADEAAGLPYGRPGNGYDPVVTVRRPGICDTSPDSLCAESMAAAGIPPPYYGSVKRYDTMCILGIGVVGKGGGAVAGNVVANQVPEIATRLGAGTRLMSLIGRGVSVFTNPATAAGSLGYAVGPLLSHCEIKPPMCEVR
ncbi:MULTISPECIES: hypothetical protein [unclassified Rhizobacter]|uniref:hypothetical protein n=1 Tax=unclassified Rhizobacter TaxID=2640088 RepID=UPI0012FB18B9|nr:MULTISPECIES: hypothetical protein [unclassified Rhizobacter]